MLTGDWLSANLLTSQIDSLRSPSNIAFINRAATVASLDSVFVGVGVQDFEEFLVRDIIQKDLACRRGRSMTEPPYPDSLLFPGIQKAVLEFLR
jgi:hypothetical protein